MLDDKEVKRAYRRQVESQKVEQAEIDQTVRDLLSAPRGRKYLWWLLQIGRVGTQPFAPNALATSFNCGELNVGQQILAHILEVDPAGYVRMMQEKADAGTRSDDPSDPSDE